MIALRAGREHAWLDDVVEGLLKLCHGRLTEVNIRPRARVRANNSLVHLLLKGLSFSDFFRS